MDAIEKYFRMKERNKTAILHILETFPCISVANLNQLMQLGKEEIADLLWELYYEWEVNLWDAGGYRPIAVVSRPHPPHSFR